MPYFERTGMISHRHPFYGVGYFAEDYGPGESLKYSLTPEEMAAGAAAAAAYESGPPSSLNRPLTEAEKAAGAAAAAAAGQVAPPAPAPAPMAAAGTSGLLLLGGAALLVFLVLKRK